MVISRTGYRQVPADQAMAVVLATTVVCSLVARAADRARRSALALPAPRPVGPAAARVHRAVRGGHPVDLFLTGIRLVGGTRAGILMLFEPVVGVALAAGPARRGAGPDPGPRRPGDPGRGADPAALGRGPGERAVGGAGHRSRRGQPDRGRPDPGPDRRRPRHGPARDARLPRPARRPRGGRRGGRWRGGARRRRPTLCPDVVVMDLLMPGHGRHRRDGRAEGAPPRDRGRRHHQLHRGGPDHRRHRGRRERLPAQGRRGRRPGRGDPSAARRRGLPRSGGGRDRRPADADRRRPRASAEARAEAGARAADRARARRPRPASRAGCPTGPSPRSSGWPSGPPGRTSRTSWPSSA